MAAAAAAYPPWVLLERYCPTFERGSNAIPDTKTLAAAHTTSNHLIGVALSAAALPEGSCVCVELPDGVHSRYPAGVLAAHGDSVLIDVTLLDPFATDLFVYNAGDAAAATPRPPSLSLLPRHPRGFLSDQTGLLRRGEDELVVAELRMEYDWDAEGEEVPELHLLRSGEWSVKRPPISHYDRGAGAGEGGGDEESSWRNSVVVPVGDELLCWVDMRRGLMLCKVFDESPSLRFVPLPDDHYFGRASYRNVCATAGAAGGGDAIRFVNMFPRCCGGDAKHTFCRRSRHAYTVHTWTLRMEDDDITWVKDGVLDATELWGLDGYNGVPRVRLDCPVVSLDEPHDICFVVCEGNHQNYADDETTWMIMVDMKSKTLRSVFRYPTGRGVNSRDYLCPSRVSDYFNSEKASSLKKQPDAVPNLGTKSHSEIEIEPQTKDRRCKSPQYQGESSAELMQASKAASREAMILAALEEIPGLDRDDMLKAYRILSHDDSGRRFRSIMGLPMNLRKDCVLLEIRASEACSICSACSANLQLQE